MKNLALALYCAMACLWLVNVPVSATTIQVGKGQSVRTIKAGLAQAKSGDTVLVAAGVYKEGNIVIDKAIFLKGLGKPVLDGEKKYEPLSIKSPQVTVQGFLIQHSGHSSMNDIAGIKIYNTAHIKIFDNELVDNFFGIYAQNATNVEIRGNILKAFGTAEQLIGNGIHAWKSDSLSVENNEVSGHRDGIYLEFVTHTRVQGNLSEKNLRYGLHFMFSHENSYISNTFRSNGAGVAVMYTKHVHMENNNFEENWGDAAYGLLLKDISDSQIINNLELQ